MSRGLFLSGFLPLYLIGKDPAAYDHDKANNDYKIPPDISNISKGHQHRYQDHKTQKKYTLGDPGLLGVPLRIFLPEELLSRQQAIQGTAAPMPDKYTDDRDCGANPSGFKVIFSSYQSQKQIHHKEHAVSRIQDPLSFSG